MDDRTLIEISESLKLLDQKIAQMRDTLKLIDKNTLEKYSELSTSISDLINKVSSIEERLDRDESEIRMIEAQIKELARVEDLKVLQKYLELIDPTRFLSKEDVIKIIEEYLEKNKWR